MIKPSFKFLGSDDALTGVTGLCFDRRQGDVMLMSQGDVLAMLRLKIALQRRRPAAGRVLPGPHGQFVLGL
jgi:hypothetical protein